LPVWVVEAVEAVVVVEQRLGCLQWIVGRLWIVLLDHGEVQRELKKAEQEVPLEDQELNWMFQRMVLQL
jgi:hypothetical protein